MKLLDAALFMQMAGLAAFLLVFMAGLFAVGNMVRGGWRPRWRVFFDAQGNRLSESARPWWDKSDPLFSLLHAVVLAVPMGPLAIAAGAGNQLGSASGWGQYIGTYLNGAFEGGTPSPEVGIIDRLIARWADEPLKYGMAGMVLRGIMWSLCSFLVIFLTWQGLHVIGFNMDVPAHWWLGPLGYAAMPFGFFLSKRLASPSRAWLVGEGINGGIIGLIWWMACL